MRISDWSSDVCSSDLSFEHCSSNPLLAVPSSVVRNIAPICPDISPPTSAELHYLWVAALLRQFLRSVSWNGMTIAMSTRSEEHTSELQSLMRNSYAVFSLKKTTYITQSKKHTKNQL